MQRGFAMVRSCLWVPIFFLGSVVIVLTSGLAAFVAEGLFFLFVRLWARWNRGCARWILGQKVVVRGTIPEGPVFFLFKHEDMFETVDLPRLLRRPVVFAKQELFTIPVWGVLAKRYGLIPIERSAGASALRTMRKAALGAIAAGRPLALFPEGTRVAHGQAPSIRSGFAGVYKLLGLPAVPVAINSGALKDGWVRLPGTITYLVGETIPPGLPREEAEALAHAALNALNSAHGAGLHESA